MFQPRAVNCWLLLFCAVSLGARAETAFESQLVEAAGRVEMAAAGATNWVPAVVNQTLRPGGRLRTGADSRATLRLSDRSVIRVNELTILQIQAPAQPARHGFLLQRGGLLFLNREKPADIEFQTPLAAGAIRGTEFLLAAAPDGATRLALWEGAVQLTMAGQVLDVSAGKEVLLERGKPPQLSAVLPVANLIQWAFYYPAVLNPRDVAFTASEASAFSNSIAAYNSGDFVRALALAPEALATGSDGARVYFAALKLSVGQAAKAGELLKPVGAAGDSLRLVIAAVKHETSNAPLTPANSSDWLAQSYYAQSRSRLAEALNAARRAAELAPDFGPAWARLGELEFDLGHRRGAEEALGRARRLAPRDAETVVLEGYFALADFHSAKARSIFDRALEMDGALPAAWLGRGLAEAQNGNYEAARRDIETSVALEPQRGVFRAYLGKAWSQLDQDKLADKEFALAERFDPGDPTAWLYAALHRFQDSQVNDAVRDLEQSMRLNDNRSVFRSRLQLDEDQASRSADIAAIYDAAGMNEVGVRAAGNAVDESYSDFAGHLFLAQSLQLEEDPSRYNLRFETARESELLVANLLAPPGGGNLSQILSQQDRLNYFGERPVGFSSLTEADSSGYWSESATAFGSRDGFSFALDTQYTDSHGQRDNNSQRDTRVSFQAKEQITPSDSVYFQAEFYHDQNGDIAGHYFPTNSVAGLRVTEEQIPNVYLGWHHEWGPGSHTLFLLARLEDRLTLTNPTPSVLFLRQNGTQIIDVGADPFFSLDQESHFTLYSAELQQIWESEHHALVVGGRVQDGSVDTHATLTRLFGETLDQQIGPGMNRADAYGYYEWKPMEQLHLTAGLVYDALSFPANAGLPPLGEDKEQRELLGPKAGFTAELWREGWLRGAWSRSLGGVSFDNSIRLEPSQIAGLTTAYRSIIPESVEGLVPGSTFDVWSLAFDQRLSTETYFGAEAGLSKSRGSRDVGAFSNAIPFIAVPDSPTSTTESLRYAEKSFSAYASQLLGRDFAAGARYRWTEGALKTTLPQFGGISDAALLTQDEHARLQHVQLYLLFNHPSGFFAEWSSDWYQQHSDGVGSPGPGGHFWQHNIFAGYRFAHRRAELRLGVVNLTDRAYQLNPLNLQSEPQWRRTFTASLRLSF